MQKVLTIDEVLELLRKKQGETSQKELAQQLGISAGYLCDILKGHREPGDSVLRFLGLNREVVYVRNTRQERKTRRVGKNAVA